MRLVAFVIMLAALGNTCTAQTVPYNEQKIYKDKFSDAIPVLNVATFHMGFTSDASSTKFDEHDRNNQEEIKKVASLLAAFKPTIIVIEDLPANDSARLADFLDYCRNPAKKFKDPDERELLAYEVGRLTDARKIYGIDFKESYNYNIGGKIANPVDKTTVNKYWSLLDYNEKKNPEEGIPFYDLFKLNNHPQYLESLININADMLTYTSTKGKSEGADEAAKFYHRNLVMYSNLNQLPVTPGDRIFILMGGTHTAFFNEFLKRSPKYQLVNVFDFLK